MMMLMNHTHDGSAKDDGEGGDEHEEHDDDNDDGSILSHFFSACKTSDY